MKSTNDRYKVSALVSLAALTAVFGLLGAASAEAGGGSHRSGPGTGGFHLQLGHVNAPAADDPFWQIRNPGGPVELNPQPLPPRYLGQGIGNPAATVGFNPQPDPPGVL